MPTNFKDLFSKQSTDYAKFRPSYPPALFAYLATLVKEHQLAWDCGTGNGQAAVMLAGHFDAVIATDPSSKQIDNAVSHPKVTYQIATAEQSGLENASINLTTVAQAFHWFDHERFASEVARVSRPGAILAVWCYELAKINKAVDAVVLRLERDILWRYWEKERTLVDEGYRSVVLPFKEMQSQRFEMTATWTLEHLIGYLKTWSALQKFLLSQDPAPIEAAFAELKNAWGHSPSLPARWDLVPRIWAVNQRSQ